MDIYEILSILEFDSRNHTDTLVNKVLDQYKDDYPEIAALFDSGVCVKIHPLLDMAIGLLKSMMQIRSVERTMEQHPMFQKRHFN